MSTVLNIVKVGGSSLTVKESKHTLNDEHIDWTCDVFAQLMHQSESCDRCSMSILVHGAGSFGHFEAKEHGLSGSEARFDPRSSLRPPLLMGVCETRNAVLTLNRHLVQRLCNRGVPAVGVSPFHFIRSVKHREIDERDCKHLAQFLFRLLMSGFLPVLHGDVIYDDNGGNGDGDGDDYGEAHCVTVLSGDKIVELLAKYMPKYCPNKMITFDRIQCTFVTDVSGVYLKCPTLSDEESGTGLLSRIVVSRTERGKVQQLVLRRGSGGQTTASPVDMQNIMHNDTIETENRCEHDVTGGFETKLSSAFTVLWNAASQEQTEYEKDRVVNVIFVKVGSNDARNVILLPHAIPDKGTVMHHPQQDA